MDEACAAAIPAALTARAQWVVWRAALRDGSLTKVPFRADGGGKAKANDPATWAPYAQALTACRAGRFAGIGFVFSADDPFAGLDLDDCRDPATGEIAPWARALLDRLDTYCEVSPSGTGVKAWVRATKPGPRARLAPHVEMYDRGRYFAVTGRRLPEYPPTVESRQATYSHIYEQIFSEKPAHHLASQGPPKVGGSGEKPTVPQSSLPDPPTLGGPRDRGTREQGGGPSGGGPPGGGLDDDVLLAKARAGAKGAVFAALWAGARHGHGSASEADLALCNLLAFYAGPDPARVDALFRRSGLFREKWDARHRGDGATYGQMTVAKALAGRTTFYGQAPPARETPPARLGSPPPRSGEEGEVTRPTPLLSSPAGGGWREERATGGVSVPWEPPLPLGPAALPAFPTEALPPAVAAYVREVAAATQVPADMPGMLALAVLAAAGSRLCVVQVGETHAEPLNLYVAVVMEPGSRKSATLEAMAAPLREAERTLLEARLPAITAARERRGVEEKHLDGRRLAASKEEDPALRAALVAGVAAAADALPPVPPLPRLLADDVTPEKLAGLLAEHDGVMAILSAEGGIFGILAGRYAGGGGANLDLFLKAHAGEDFRSDRVGRASEHIPRATLTMGLAVQPDVLQSLGGTGAFRGRGLLGRFLYSVPASLAGTRLYHSRRVAPDVREGYLALMRAVLAKRPPEAASPHPPSVGGPCEPGASEQGGGPGLRHTLTLGGEALGVWAEYHDGVERRQGPGGDLAHATDWASKLAGAVARIAGGMHLAALADHPAPWDVPLSCETVLAAWAVGEYLVPHALAAFGRMAGEPARQTAQKVLAWLARAGPAEFSRRDAQRALSVTADEAGAAVALLVEAGYLRARPPARNEMGRPLSPTFQVNPQWERAPAAGEVE